MVGVLALVLAVPLAIIANILTLLVRKWWSTTSDKRLRRRIAKLEGKVLIAESTWKFTPAEWLIRRAVYRLSKVVVVGFHAIFSLLAIVVVIYHSQIKAVLPVEYHPTATAWGIAFVVLCAYVGNLVLGALARRMRDLEQEMHSEMGLQDLKHEIARLTSLCVKRRPPQTGQEEPPGSFRRVG